ncbi:UNVERIFIED_CONTAM: hypothetical protein Sangu_2419100 [Sesamum angustifolium]|uniref:DUF4283 domain-containing protein n=1 Tax=Sesamum angustifolium TaxID=2727405 RepID=A0AAW2KXX2_9LAMI
MEDEGEEGELEDGGHGAVSAAPATSPAVEEGEEGELHVGGNGTVSAAPATVPAAEDEATMEKLKTEFNLKEFFELASRVIDEGDSDSMEVLENLKQKWLEKLGGKFPSVGHGGFRSVRSRQATPAPKLRPARRFSRWPATEHVDLTLNSAAPPSCNMEPQKIMLPWASQRPLTAAAAACGASTAAHSEVKKSPRFATLLTIPTPWTATSIEVDDGLLPSRSHHEPLIHPPIWASSPPISAVSTVKPPSIDSMLGLNRPSQHQSPAGSSPPIVQPAENRAPSPEWERVKLPQLHAAPAPLFEPYFMPQPSEAAAPTSSAAPAAAAPTSTAAPAATAAPAKSLPELYFGNIPLNPHMVSKIDEDKIAEAFHNSTRKTLNYIPPAVQNGEVIVCPSFDMIRTGSHRWNTTAIGYFLGKKPYFHHLNEFVHSIWPGVRDVKATSNGFFFFQFETIAAMEDVIEGGPWLYLGQPIVLQKWEPGMVLRKLKHTEVTVWIKLRHLPVELWTTEGLSTVASGIGRPLYPDAITRACTRLDFARVCVMLNVTSKLPKYVVIMMPNEFGGESACKVDVEYEWLPPKCTGCSSLGDSTKECPLSKPTKPVVSIYVRKSIPITPAPPKLKMKEHVQADPVSENIHPETEVDRISKEMLGNGRDKAIWNVRGLNRRDHQVAVRDLVCEFRLRFIALLETRVLQSNVTRIQSGVLSRWRWFVDYAGPGNRIWIAWNDELIDVDILNVGTQFVHCRVLVHELHESIFITVVYGANDVSTRRELWQELIDLAGTIGNVPWLVGGDFNAVLDMSEVSGASGDIRVAMNEFNDYILQTGLLFPSYASLDGRSLWKRLDRLLVNDVWMDRWPNLYYTCLTPRTSDHSPMVLKGDCRNMQRAKLQWLKGGDQCSKIFFRRVATRRANKRVFQISDDVGNEQTDPTVISSIFVDFFQGLLGGDRTDRAIDLRYLRPWARHILTDDEARAIIRPITIDEVKTTFFDIEEDKAPGPDGFSSGFFKAAWPVVGGEVSNAIIDFFKTGRLLKQLNATLLTLIPKVRTPNSVAEFRPISCCNVIYKVITKILDLIDSPHSRFEHQPPKSQLILSKAASGLRDSLLATLGFQEGQLPVRYLGLPLISARLSIADCQPLLQKIDSRIKGWEGVQLSFAGRVQLIKSV